MPPRRSVSTRKALTRVRAMWAAHSPHEPLNLSERLPGETQTVASFALAFVLGSHRISVG